MVTIPETREAAIAALVELDVAKWGESERQASRQLHEQNCPSYGVALNALAHRPEYHFGDDVPELVAAASAALAGDDIAVLRQGG